MHCKEGKHSSTEIEKQNRSVTNEWTQLRRNKASRLLVGQTFNNIFTMTSAVLQHENLKLLTALVPVGLVIMVELFSFMKNNCQK